MWFIYLIISYNIIKITYSLIIESPEDLTVVIGDPATLICRVDNRDVKWFKDGMEMNIDDDKEIVVLPDGSLFFLSPRLEDTALYNCGYEEDDGEIVTSRPAAIIVVTERDDTNMEVENISEIYSQENKRDTDISATKGNKSTKRHKIHVEYLEEEIPRKVYIISMIIVGGMTVVIIAGAAVIFRKIKNLPSEQSPEDPMVTGKEWQTPMMARTCAVEYSDKSWQREHMNRHYDFYNDNVHHYETPLQLQNKSSEDLLSSRYLGKYVQLKPVYLLPNNAINKQNEKL